MGGVTKRMTTGNRGKTRDMITRAQIVARLAFLNDPEALAHAQRVAGRLPADDKAGRTVALLHDVVEDTPVSLTVMHGWFPAELLGAVAELTRQDGEAYFEYVARVAAGSELARRVKIADAQDNLQRCLDDGNRARALRYRRALRILGAANGDEAAA
jgi:(p)ppGpp synthase/HD superfamily hydrolase